MHLERLVSLMEIIAAAGKPVAVADIQAASDLPRPTCYRLVQTLREHGLIENTNEDGRYTIGDRLARIALSGKTDGDLSRVSAPLLRSAATTLNETAFLARLRNSKVEIFHVETPDDPARAFIHPGIGDRPLHACSCSKVIAAFAKDSFREKILSGARTRFTDKTKTSRTAILNEFDHIRHVGYADCDQEIDIGIASVAAPITIDAIGTTFSVGAVGPVRRFPKELRQKVGKQLIQIATNISGAIQNCSTTEV